jgi:spoIIIJ-associated protein
MEWVEVTGRTVEEALDVALDELGVDEQDVEYEVVTEPRGGLFGRIGGTEARIRARVKPLSREKPGERRRRGRGGRSGGGDRGSSGERPQRRERAGSRPAAEPDGQRSRRRSRGRKASAVTEMDESVSEMSPAEQAAVAAEFVTGLLEAFGVEASVRSEPTEEERVAVDIEGPDVGILVGPRGATLAAIEELTRTVVQRRTDGRGARMDVDVGGYRARRREALAGFATELADKVLESGTELALEPMGPADRKVVHDTVAAIDGVTTASEGEEPRRRVVIRSA